MLKPTCHLNWPGPCIKALLQLLYMLCEEKSISWKGNSGCPLKGSMEAALPKGPQCLLMTSNRKDLGEFQQSKKSQSPSPSSHHLTLEVPQFIVCLAWLGQPHSNPAWQGKVAPESPEGPSPGEILGTHLPLTQKITPFKNALVVAVFF